jgi:phospholipid/cholesterol/gamma-HCH transport system substrate-binding protein
MMITRIARIQVIVFLVLSLAGVAFVGIRYVGIGDQLLGDRYTLYADLNTAGGIYSNAPVTYRGVPIGRISSVRLHGNLVRVGMVVKRSVPVPRDLTAVVAQRSAVGEQYLDLRPNSDAGPYLRNGEVIPADRTGTPLPMETLLANLEALVGSVNTNDLSMLIDQLGVAFETDETALRQILDSSSALLAAANQYLPQTQTLINDSNIVLSTQFASSSAIRQWAAALAQLTGVVRKADPDLRRLLTAGPPAAEQIIGLLRDLDPTVGTLLGNLITVNGIAARRLPGIEQILVVYPLVVAGGFTVAPGDGTAHFGLVVSASNAPCQYRQTGQSGCTASERAKGSGVRSSANAPGPTGPDPKPAPLGGQAGPGTSPATSSGPASGASSDSQQSAGTVAGFDPATGLVTGGDGMPLQFGGTGGQFQLAGEQSWKQLLLAGLAQ